MIPRSSILRVARPTDNLVEITRMYIDGLGFKLLGSFTGHDGFDGAIIGHPSHSYHLEFTHHQNVRVGRAPTQENLLVFYIPEANDWANCCEKMLRAGFNVVTSYNPYWDLYGSTFEDVDGYRVVLKNRDWTV